MVSTLRLSYHLCFRHNLDMGRHDRLLLHDLFIFTSTGNINFNLKGSYWHFFKIREGELFGPGHLLDSALSLVTDHDFVNNWKENSLNDSFVYLNINSLMQYPNVEARNWRLAFKIIKRIFALFLSGALHLDGKQRPECHTITIFDQCKLLYNVIWIHPQMTARSVN